MTADAPNVPDAPGTADAADTADTADRAEPVGADAASPIRVVVSDDHPVVRQGLRSFLESRGFAVVGEAADGDEAVRLVRELEPDVLLTDVVMPGVDGIDAIRRLRADGADVGILVLTSFSGSDQVIPAIQAGADGYLLKDAGPAALEDAVRAVQRGEPMLAPEAAAVVMARVVNETSANQASANEASANEATVDEASDSVDEATAGGTSATRQGRRVGGGEPSSAPEHPDLARLTPREREVLAGLGRGLSNRDLAAELFVSEKTIKTHVSSVLAKLRLSDRTQAALFAVRVGVADPRTDPRRDSRASRRADVPRRDSRR